VHYGSRDVNNLIVCPFVAFARSPEMKDVIPSNLDPPIAALADFGAV
jgi:hypothetical protein